MQALITQSPSSPSFNSYSSENLTEIAARVVREFTNDQPDDYDCNIIFNSLPEPENSTPKVEEDQEIMKLDEEETPEEEAEEEEFEFAIPSSEPAEPPISAGDIFYNGQIRPTYPLFNTSLLLEKDEQLLPKSAPKPNRLPLRKLFSEERETSTTTSSSSSEADELESVPEDSYCAWKPKSAASISKKSRSTGTSSKRWKLRDLLNRSRSDGKETFVFLAPPAAAEKKSNGGDVVEVEEHYVKNRAVMKEGDKRRSFLPYRQDLVGFFSNANGLSRNLRAY
ncbi:uncharacterized protein LOC126671116 [Mercurialis annua]|uniref:uncharacterized protein LOC126671116 n=1 Tax=Mercurialis annua TaxID=3986 RepID=UPI002160D801|nr:uncharacterized protein LOC126671116 [Mercurialis annua]